TLERPDVRAFARLDGVVTVIDCANHARVREVAEWQAQVRSADIIVLSKEDLVATVETEQVLSDVRELNACARVVRPTVQSVASLLLDTVAPRPERAVGTPNASHSSFRAVSVVDAKHEFALTPLEDWLSALPYEVYRAKG